jgi:hypothetical protein
MKMLLRRGRGVEDGYEWNKKNPENIGDEQGLKTYD